MPGGITLDQAFDTGGNLTDLGYTGDVTTTDDTGTSTTAHDQPWIAWSQTHDALGRIIDQWTPDGATLTSDTTGAAATGYSRHYTYDRADRLTEVIDQEATSTGSIADPADTGATDATTADGADGLASTACVVRDYTFDADGNRTALQTTPAAADGSCQTGSSPTGVTTKTWTYDDADRLTGGYVYDALGRQTTIPQNDTPAATAGGSPGDLTLGYYDTDALHTQTQGGITITNTLDAVGRPLTQATGPPGGAASSTVTMGYDDSGDSPAFATTAAGGVTSRAVYVSGLDGLLAATLTGSGQVQVAVADPHGDVVAQITLPASGDASGLDEWTDADEYGNAINGTPVGATATNSPGNPAGDPTARPGYGWLGTHQRPTQGTGMVQTGARLYNPATGTFTCTDPLYRGNTAAYAYPQDPINRYDLNGQWWHWIRRVAHYVGAGVAGAAKYEINKVVQGYRYLKSDAEDFVREEVNRSYRDHHQRRWDPGEEDWWWDSDW